ncbi:MAG: sulfotransferase [Candidatus Aenigmatarchaeota archaeon]|nr:MAG: sulfotransferase [Candidatus Aenigmarchaeota archaeon]
MTLPNFIICGTQRGGTTSLYYYLKEHPQIFMPSKKEIHFFDLHYKKGIEWYKRHFREAKNSKIRAIGEASPSYMYFEEVPERIHEVIPDVKLIFILRNPVDRAYSHYWHEVRLGYEWLSFEEAIKVEQERLAKGDIINRRHYSYLDRGKYIEQIKRFRKYFSKDQMLILITEELRSSPETVMRQIFEFLQVNPDFKSESWYNKKFNIGKRPRIKALQRIKGKLHRIQEYYFPQLAFLVKPIMYAIDIINLTKGYPKMSLETRKFLIKHFELYNKELEVYLERRLDFWYL